VFDQLKRSVRNTLFTRRLHSDDRNNAPLFLLPAPRYQSGGVEAEPFEERTINRMIKTLKESTERVVPTVQRLFPRLRNLSLNSLRFLQSIRFNLSIVIKPADKNLGLTILDREWYNNECARQLNDSATYRSITHTECLQLNRTAASQIIRLTNTAAKADVITRKEANFIQFGTDNPNRCASLYLIPKIHKKPLTGRPIVASHSTVTTQASKWIDIILQPLLSSVSPVLRDSSQLVRRIEQSKIDRNHRTFQLLSADVTSLYPSIPIDNGIRAVNAFIEERSSSLPPLKRKLVIDLLSTVLKFNTFNCDHTAVIRENNEWRCDPSRLSYFLQLKGTAMGTACAVVFANIFMYQCFDLPLHRLFGMQIQFYGRFIDDIFTLLWTGGSPGRKNALSLTRQPRQPPLQSSKSITDAMNSLHPSIKLTVNVSNHSVEFLDLNLTFGERWVKSGKLDISVHQKAMNAFLYVPHRSYHTTASKQSFIRAELIRFIRNSSSLLSFLLVRKRFFYRLRNRGYSDRFLRPIFESLDYSMRSKFLTPRKQSNSDSNRLNTIRPLICKLPLNPTIAFTPFRSIIHSSISSFDNVIARDPIVAYIRPLNLRSMLCRASVVSSSPSVRPSVRLTDPPAGSTSSNSQPRGASLTSTLTRSQL